MVGISNLRRLAADHAMLHSTELPPCYLFPPSSTDSSVDDLTQLNIYITGPSATPYSQGLWRLSLKIPESYPKVPPKAAFRTRIWHPNVEENTGSVCVDTLKRDWQPNLTLRDVLVTIYCLLIQPNPDSALNATAGHLLQDEYDSFARQARLMTSIHAKIPPDLTDAALLAKRRGDIASAAVGELNSQKTTKSEYGSSWKNSLVRKLPELLSCAQSASSALDQALDEECSGSGGEHRTSASKENESLLSPRPVPLPSPRRPSMAKRPLSDLQIIRLEHEVTGATCLNPSDRNIVENALQLTSTAVPGSPQRGLQLAETIQGVNKTVGNQEVGVISMGSDDPDGRPNKRICANSGKENTPQDWGARKLVEKPLFEVGTATKSEIPTSRYASAPSFPGTSIAKGKLRTGLKRL